MAQGAAADAAASEVARSRGGFRTIGGPGVPSDRRNGPPDKHSGLQAVFFDMDGLLVDSEPLWFEVESMVMARLGGHWSPADQHALIGGTLDQTVSYLLDRASQRVSPQAVGGWLIDGMTSLLAERDPPLQPGAGELHADLTAAGIPTALVSSSQPPIVSAVLAGSGLRFDAVVTG